MTWDDNGVGPEDFRADASIRDAAPGMGARSAGRWFNRLGPIGDLLIVAGLLLTFEVPLTTSAAIASAAVVATFVRGGGRLPLCVDPGSMALRSVRPLALVLLAAFPVAWVDGVLWEAVLVAAAAVGAVFAFRFLLACAVCGVPAGQRRVAIAGTGPRALEIAEYLTDNDVGLSPVGFIDRQVQGEVPLPILGPPDDLATLVLEEDIDTLIVAFGDFSEGELVADLRRCEELPIEVVVVPRFFELALVDTHDELWGYPVARLQDPAETRGAWRMKRLLDVAGASALLVLFSPVMAAVAFAVRASGRGPILFKQERVGHRGRTFDMYKFRSMVENDDSDLTWSVEFDDRVTPVGGFIRHTHLDELPQLFNVLRGDMSLVGPRPERPHFVKLFASKFDGYEERHRVPVGITGWSQVNGLWGDTSLEARSRLDNRYVESWSLGRDLVILLRTVPTMFKRRS